MARIINNENHLENEYQKYRRKYIIYGFLTFLSFILFLPTFGLTFLPFMIFGFLWNRNRGKASVLYHGLQGERKSMSIFSYLPDEYMVLADINVKVDQNVSQIDHIVIGDNGVFVIETKNLNGVIEGNEEDKQITQHKVGRKGGEYSKQFYNPIKQVSTHVFRVSELLKRNGIRTWIQGMVYFTNQEAEVYLNSRKVPVFASSEEGDKEIISYILNYENRKSSITKQEQKKIAALLVGFQSSYGEGDYDIDNNDILFNQHIQNHLDMQNQEFMRQTMEEGRKAVTPFDHGGYVQGPGFNPSDTMHHEMNNMDNNNMF